MKLEENKTFRTRSGETIKIKAGIHLNHPWASFGADARTWMSNGRFINNTTDSPNDFVNEVIAAPETPIRTPHVHAKELRAFADGYEIEFFSTIDARAWVVIDNPGWDPDTKYRVKPEPEPNVVTWCAVLCTGGLGYGDKNRSNAQQPNQTALLRIEIDHNDPASPRLVSATLEKP